MNKGFSIILLVFLIAEMFFYNLHETSFMRPQGLHQWRQSVGAAYAKNYYNYNLDPTESRIYNNIVDEATSDKAFAEFPLLYYSVAILYKIFGPHEFIFRIFNLLILFLGLFYLMKLLNFVLKNQNWSLLLTLLLFTSPVLVYYSNSFLPNTTALAISFIALFHIGKYSANNDTKHIWYASLFFTIAGLTKITSLIPFFAITGSFIIFQIFNTDFRKKFAFSQFVVPAIIPVLAIVLWYLFVSIYHSNHGGNISAVEIRPIWKLNAEVIEATWKSIWNNWLHTYFHPSVFLFAILCLIAVVLKKKRQNQFQLLFLLLFYLISIAFFFMFFRSLKSHDYYLINLFPIIILTIALGIKFLLSFPVSKLIHYSLQLLVAGFLVFLITETKVEIKKKLYNFNYWHTQWFHGLEDIEPELRKAGINQFDKVISIPDPSINISLNMMNQPGYTDFIRMNIPVDERIDFQISKGAKYLVLGDSLLYQKDKRAYVKKYMKKKVLTHANIVVYDLRDFQTF